MDIWPHSHPIFPEQLRLERVLDQGYELWIELLTVTHLDPFIFVNSVYSVSSRLHSIASGNHLSKPGWYITLKTQEFPLTSKINAWFRWSNFLFRKWLLDFRVDIRSFFCGEDTTLLDQFLFWVEKGVISSVDVSDQLQVDDLALKWSKHVERRWG